MLSTLIAENSRLVIPFTLIQPADGLSEGVVHCIFRDSRGFIWFGTQGGLNRYDGFKIKLYKKGTTIGSTPSNNQIISILEDKDGKIWVGSAEGLNRFDPKKESFIHYQNKGDNTISGDNAIDDLLELSDSTLLVGTFGHLHTFNKRSGKFKLIESSDENTPAAIHDFLKVDDKTILVASGTGLFLYDLKEGKTKISSGNYNFEKLLGKNIWTVIRYNGDEIWAANANGYFSINTKNSSVRFIDISQPQMDDDFQVRSILKDSKGDVWFGTNSGLLKFDGVRKKYTLFRSDPLIQHTISSDRISTMLEDNSGLLWIGTFGGGVNKINLKQKKFYNFTGGKQKGRGGLEFNFIMHIHGDSKNNLFVSSLDKGFAVYDQKETVFHNFSPFLNKMKYNAATFYYFAFPYDENKYFINDQESFYSYSIGSDFRPKLNYSFYLPMNISCMIRDQQKIFWCGNSIGIQKFREADNGKSFTDISFFYTEVQTNFILDRDSILWVGANGLIKFSKNTGYFKKYYPSDYFKNKKMSNVIYFVHDDKRGNLWLGTYSDGLLKYNIAEDEFDCFTVQDGLPDNTIYAILEDRSGNLWLSTNKGLSNYDIRNNRFINYDQSDGLINSEYNRKACYKDKDGIMYFGGIEGIDYFNPDEIMINETIPQIVLTDFKLFTEVTHILMDQYPTLNFWVL